MTAAYPSCWECLRAENHAGTWPFYEADCAGCEARALAAIVRPAEPPETPTLNAKLEKS